MITDNLSSHDSKATRAWLEDHPRIRARLHPQGRLLAEPAGSAGGGSSGARPGRAGLRRPRRDRPRHPGGHRPAQRPRPALDLGTTQPAPRILPPPLYIQSLRNVALSRRGCRGGSRRCVSGFGQGDRLLTGRQQRQRVVTGSRDIKRGVCACDHAGTAARRGLIRHFGPHVTPRGGPRLRERADLYSGAQGTVTARNLQGSRRSQVVRGGAAGFRLMSYRPRMSSVVAV